MLIKNYILDLERRKHRLWNLENTHETSTASRISSISPTQLENLGKRANLNGWRKISILTQYGGIGQRMTICLFLTLIRVRATAFSNQESRNLSRISCDNRSRSVFFASLSEAAGGSFFPNFFVFFLPKSFCPFPDSRNLGRMSCASARVITIPPSLCPRLPLIDIFNQKTERPFKPFLLVLTHTHGAPDQSLP